MTAKKTFTKGTLIFRFKQLSKYLCNISVLLFTSNSLEKLAPDPSINFTVYNLEVSKDDMKKSKKQSDPRHCLV